MIYFVLLALFIITCIWIIYRYYKKKNGIFQAPFIFSLASMLMMTPQFSTIILNPYYNPDLLLDLSWIMITGTLAFSFGFEKANQKKIISCKDLYVNKSKKVLFLIFLIGLYAAWQSDIVAEEFRNSGGSDIRNSHTYQIWHFFRLFLDFGYFYALAYVAQKKKCPRIIGIIIVLGSIYYLIIVLAFARRALAVKLFLSITLLLSMAKPQWLKQIRIIVIIFFTVGTVYNASIGEIRSNLVNTNKEKIDVNYWENYKRSYYAPPMNHGMDLGNGALFIKYTKEHMNYNFGLFLWNDIVTWYCPSFIFGKEGKEAMKFADNNRTYIQSISHGVTTSTGYYVAFAAFGYFGFILFYALGYILGFIWNCSKYSLLYLVLYMSLMYNIPNLASHGFSYIIGNIETFIVFCIPIIYQYIYSKKTNRIHILHRMHILRCRYSK